MVFPQELFHLVTLSSGMSVVTSCASASERTHSSSSNCFDVGSFSFFKNISCEVSRKRHSSGKSPVAHSIVRMSSPRNRRLLWPAPAEGDNGIQVFVPFTSRTGALIDDSLTWRSEAMPVLLGPYSLIALRASLWRPPPQAVRAPSAWWDEFQCPSSER